MTLRVGILGAGQAGERQAIGFDAGGADVAAVADLAAARAAELAARFDARPYTDWRAMLDQELDIVAVCLPHNLHVAPTEHAAARGIHVMMEKPLATSMADAQRIVNACQEAGVLLTVSFVHRFREEIQVLKQWLLERALGQPVFVRETMNGQRGAHLPGWVESLDAAGGGVLMYSAIHGVDRLRWLLDSEVTAVTAQTRTFEEGAEVEHSVAALLTFANGASGTLTANAPAYVAKPSLWETEIFGDQGMARARTRFWAEMSSDAGQRRMETTRYSEEQGIHYNFTRQAKAFMTAISEERTPAVTAADGLAAQRIVEAIYASAARGETVTIPTPSSTEELL
jgi:predicted dehydrogenase